EFAFRLIQHDLLQFDQCGVSVVERPTTKTSQFATSTGPFALLPTWHFWLPRTRQSSAVSADTSRLAHCPLLAFGVSVLREFQPCPSRCLCRHTPSKRGLSAIEGLRRHPSPADFGRFHEGREVSS